MTDLICERSRQTRSMKTWIGRSGLDHGVTAKVTVKLLLFLILLIVALRGVNQASSSAVDIPGSRSHKMSSQVFLSVGILFSIAV
jgi:hypothetical protein